MEPETILKDSINKKQIKFFLMWFVICNNLTFCNLKKKNFFVVWKFFVVQ
jgi:hypothetical protein